MPIRNRTIGAAAAIAFALSAAEAVAQASDPDTYVFLITAADRGAECGLIVDWESAVLTAEAERFLGRMTEIDQAALREQAYASSAETPCDEPAMNEWISAARPGLEAEWLPPYLMLFRAFSIQREPPELFAAATTDLDLDVAIAAIDAEIAALETEGFQPEGNQSWIEYQWTMEDVAAEMTAALAGEQARGFTAEAATTYLQDSTTIVRSWLPEQN